MHRQISLTDILRGVIDRVESETGLRCYDAPPKNAAVPFYTVQLTAKRPENTKTMYCEVFTLWIHCFAKKGGASVEVNNLIQRCEEAMTEDIAVPAPFSLVWQREAGLQSLTVEETGGRHAVLAYELKICYGFITKN